MIKKLLIGNLKMNLLSPLERERYLSGLKKELKNKKFTNVELVICPPFVHLETFRKSAGKKILLGGQNMFAEIHGPYTGEISPLMLKNLGCEYVIVGHSERRRYFSESDYEINLKVLSAMRNGLKPIICVGETKEERDAHATLQVITRQVRGALENVSRVKAKDFIIAYEPVWAVGTDMIPSSDEVLGAKVLIKKIIVGLFTNQYAQETPIIYGGSANAKTLPQVCIDPGMNGVLAGRESLIPREFIRMAELLER